MIQTVDPCEDFFRFACGRYVEEYQFELGQVNHAHTNFSHDLRQLLDAMRISTAPPICNMCMYMIDDNYDIDFGHWGFKTIPVAI